MILCFIFCLELSTGTYLAIYDVTVAIPPLILSFGMKLCIMVANSSYSVVITFVN